VTVYEIRLARGDLVFLVRACDAGKLCGALTNRGVFFVARRLP
jgi:hypothetical protein